MITNKWMVLCGVCIASFLGCIDFTIVNTALPAIQKHLNIDVTLLQWIMNSFLIALSTFMVVMARLADLYGRKLLLIIGMILFGFSSLLAGCSVTITILIIARFIQGLSCAILYTASGAIISHAFPSDETGKAMGILYGFNGFGLAIGPVLGGFITGMFGWRWVFFMNIPLILISLILCSIYASESKTRNNHQSNSNNQSNNQNNNIDYVGAVILILSLASLVISIIQGGQWGWLSYKTLLASGFALLMAVLFYFYENEIQNPIIRFSLFNNSLYISSIIASFFLAFFYCTAFFVMPLYLSHILMKSSSQTGAMLLSTTLTLALLSPFVGRWADKTNPQRLFIYGLLILGLSALLQQIFTENTSTIFILTAFGLMGVGWAFILGPSSAAAITSVPKEMAAVSLGSSWTIHNIGGAVGLSVGVAVYSHYFSPVLGYHAVMQILTISSMIAGLIIFFMSRAYENRG